ncbi:MAG: cytochrome c [Flavobacteriaceae bacterium]|nr:cytochrome c [Flavobacteriaceae bacterium]
MNGKTLISILLIFFLFLSTTMYAQDGENLFKSKCAACHKTSSKRAIGPGLANVHKKYSKKWFKSFVSSSQALVKSGDADAIKIFEEYNKTVMPDQELSDAELNALFDYIKSANPVATGADTDQVAEEKIVPFEPTKEDILIGQNLFSGKQIFQNEGPSCISCHDIRYDAIIAGGGLAMELTDSYDRLKKEGLEGIITGLPFPQMKVSYQNHQITEEETTQLIAFLKEVSEQRYYQLGLTSYKNTLLIWGIMGAIVLMGIFPIFWYKRKKESVNKRIYERQIKSRN